MEGFTQPSLARSTFRPNKLSSSSMRAAWSRRLVPSLQDTSRSTSLSGRASPRATDPINRTCVAPCLAAMRRIASRFSLIVSPTVKSATPSSPPEVYRRCPGCPQDTDHKAPDPGGTLARWCEKPAASAAPARSIAAQSQNLPREWRLFACLSAYPLFDPSVVALLSLAVGSLAAGVATVMAFLGKEPPALLPLILAGIALAVSAPSLL